MDDLNPSVRATYDSRVTGPRYHVTTSVNGKPLNFRQPVPDPFVRATVEVRSWRDLLLGLFRRRLVVEVTVGADVELMNDVLELDENTLIPGRTRKAAFQQAIRGKLATLADNPVTINRDLLEPSQPDLYTLLVAQQREHTRCRLMETRSCPPNGCEGLTCARFESDDESRWDTPTPLVAQQRELSKEEAEELKARFRNAQRPPQDTP